MQKRALIIDNYSTDLDGHFTLSALKLETPQIVEKYVDVPGMDGDVDYSEAAAGRPLYKRRLLTATLESSAGTLQERQEIMDDFIARFHGKVCKIIHPDYPQHYLTGRVSISKDFNLPSYGQLQISARCDPWRYSAVPAYLELPILTEEDNLFRTAPRAFLQEYSTCTRSTSAVASFWDMIDVLGPLRSVAVWSVQLQPNTDYFVNTRPGGGKGAWSVATSPTDETARHGLIRTGADGMLYLRFISLSPWAVSFSPILIVPARKVRIMHTGSIQTKVRADFSALSGGIGTSVFLGIGEAFTVAGHGEVREISVAPGKLPVVAYAINASQPTVPLRWNKGEL